MFKIDGISILTVEEFDPLIIRTWGNVQKPAGNRSTKKLPTYMGCVCAFDIETTNVISDKTAFMYVWQMSINNFCVVTGRTWDELKALITSITSVLKPDECLVVLDHNLSFEYQFLKGEFDLSNETIFATDTRTVVKMTLGGGRIEFRDTLRHSNMSLDSYAKTYAKDYKKTHDFDYSVTRYPWTELKDSEWRYVVHDVLALVDAYKSEMAVDGDTLYTVPMTSTGYVRRDVKAVMRETVTKSYISDIQPDPGLYYMLKQAFRGGDTHANRYYVDKKINGLVTCYDRSSSYPDVQVNCNFPMTRFQRYGRCDISTLDNWIEKGGVAFIATIKIDNCKLKSPYIPNPYIPVSKTRRCGRAVSTNSRGSASGYDLDNGRVIYAESLEISVTDIDYRIIRDQYEGDFSVKTGGKDAVYISRYRPLPDGLKKLICDYYAKKTELKGTDDAHTKMLYAKIKAKFNAIYGMSAQDPVQGDIVYDGDSGTLIDKSKMLDSRGMTSHIIGALEDNRKHAFFSYAWGVWCTAWARYRLYEAVKELGDTWEEIAEKFLYCDTDSVYVIGEHDYSGYNALRMADSSLNGGHAVDAKGKKHYLGVMEVDKSGITAFKTLGAKKYAYEDTNGLHITIAGVIKGKGAEELGDLDRFRDGYTFVRSGGLEATYNDRFEKKIRVDGHTLTYRDNVCLSPSTYTLSKTAEFERILAGLDPLGVVEAI